MGCHHYRSSIPVSVLGSTVMNSTVEGIPVTVTQPCKFRTDEAWANLADFFICLCLWIDARNPGRQNWTSDWAGRPFLELLKNRKVWAQSRQLSHFMARWTSSFTRRKIESISVSAHLHTACWERVKRIFFFWMSLYEKMWERSHEIQRFLLWNYSPRV